MNVILDFVPDSLAMDYQETQEEGIMKASESLAVTCTEAKERRGRQANRWMLAGTVLLCWIWSDSSLAVRRLKRIRQLKQSKECPSPP